MISKRIFAVTFKIHFLISLSSIILDSVVKTNKIGANRWSKQEVYPQLWEPNQNFIPPFAVLQPMYIPKYIPGGVQQEFQNFLPITKLKYMPEIIRPSFIPNFSQSAYIPKFSSPHKKIFLKNLQRTDCSPPEIVPEVAQPKTFNEIMQRKILGLMIGTASEKALHQMHLQHPGILNTLTGKIIPLNRNSSNKTGTGRRMMYFPIIHNTIVNENKNENQNENINNSPPNMTPYLQSADPNFPLLTYLLESVIKNSKNSEIVEHSGHKPIRICFEL